MAKTDNANRQATSTAAQLKQLRSIFWVTTSTATHYEAVQMHLFDDNIQNNTLNETQKHHSGDSIQSSTLKAAQKHNLGDNSTSRAAHLKQLRNNFWVIKSRAANLFVDSWFVPNFGCFRSCQVYKSKQINSDGKSAFSQALFVALKVIVLDSTFS